MTSFVHLDGGSARAVAAAGAAVRVQQQAID